MDYKKLQETASTAEKIALEQYNIQGTATPLPGELDFNFRIKSDTGEVFVMKISRPEENRVYLDFQQQLLRHAGGNKENIICPQVIPDKNGDDISEVYIDGSPGMVRLITWISGRPWTEVFPKNDKLRYSLGREAGKLTEALRGFEHEYAERDFQWDIAQGLWTETHTHLFAEEDKVYITHFQEQFRKIRDTYKKLPKGVVHNDANDHNLLVSEDLACPEVSGIIDYGDAVYTQVINDLAIACTYAIMDCENPLQAAVPIVKGYHHSHPITDQEVYHLHTLIGMRLVISLTKAAINKQKEPGNPYLLVSEKSGWKLIKKWYSVNEELAYLTFRQAIGLEAHPKAGDFRTWAKNAPASLATVFPTEDIGEIVLPDLSISSTWLGHEKEFENIDVFRFKLEQYRKQHPGKTVAGGYTEPRPVYAGRAYERLGDRGRENRCIHLGVDIWFKEGTPVHALHDGEVVTIANDNVPKGYGGLVILKHCKNNIDFYTLYGHLSPASVTHLKTGDRLVQGARIGKLGDSPDNGGWAPHLHFQVLLTLLGYENDFPGTCYLRELEVWKSICPDPNTLLKTDGLNPYKDVSNTELITFRKEHLGKSLSLLYDNPIKMVRGSGVYLIDQFGQHYMDTVNNVAHVGHECPEVVEAGQKQMALINTNTRYLHSAINALTERLLKTLPPELSVLHFVNSGSEANELALRMVKAHTGSAEMIVSEVGYHGNTNACVDISSYKFDGKGGKGKPEHTHVFPLPDSFRGKYRGEDAADRYAEEVRRCIGTIAQQGKKVGGLIVEPIVSCGGQIELPEGFLARAYREVRKAGGICISDEVQVGCGRVGKAFWGFQLHGVVPDIVTIGKPLGNGHPLAAVACTREVADSFANGMEYFNTFGGNPVSCAIGNAVLTYIEENNLQQRAFETGEFLKSELKKLAEQFPIIGDVRGQGLFLGIELVDRKLNPLPRQAHYLVQRMKDFNILMSTDGPDHNVLKIKPPIVFNRAHAETLVHYLGMVLRENFMTGR